MVLTVTLRVAIARNDSSSVFPVYRVAASAWIEGGDLYTLDFSKPCFRYHPLIAAVFTPFNLVPEKVAAIVWRWLGAALFISGLVLWQRQFLSQMTTPMHQRCMLLLTAPLALQSLNNAQVNLHLIGLILLGMVAAARERWTAAAVFMSIATIFKLYPIAIGLLMALSLPRKFAVRYGVLLIAACLLPCLVQYPEYVARQYRLWFQYLFVDARHTGSIEQAPRDLFLLVRFWLGAPPEWLYRGVQLGSAALIAAYCWHLCHETAGRTSGPASLLAIFHLGCLWMTLLGPSTESCTYTLLAPTAAAMLMAGYASGSRLLCGLSVAGYALLILPVVAAIFPGGTRLQHWGPQPAGALLLSVAVVLWLVRRTDLQVCHYGQAITMTDREVRPAPN
jgi:hypothetical protein